MSAALAACGTSDGASSVPDDSNFAGLQIVTNDTSDESDAGMAGTVGAVGDCVGFIDDGQKILVAWPRGTEVNSDGLLETPGGVVADIGDEVFAGGQTFSSEPPNADFPQECLDEVDGGFVALNDGQ